LENETGELIRDKTILRNSSFSTDCSLARFRQKIASILTASGARYELTGLVKKSLDVTLAALPMLHGQAPDVANKAKGGEGGVEKQGEQAATVS